ncbi:MAG: hypothetical protein AAGE52_12075 [Myxococcota bacterium]
MPTPTTSKSRADLALSTFLAPLATGRRVLWVGDATTGAPEHLASHAASVRALDTSGRGRRRRGGVAHVSVYRPGVLTFEPGSFDVAVVPDITILDDPGEKLAELARILGDGLVVAGAPTGRAEATVLRAHLRAAFREVRLLGQAPFSGVALADLTADSVDEIVVDGSLLGHDTESVDRLFGIAADELPTFDGYTLVQLAGEAPREQKDTDAGRLEEALGVRSREAEALRDALERAESRLEQVQARLVAKEAEAREARLQEEAAEEYDDIARLEEVLQERGARVRELEAEIERRAILVRDLTEELREHQLGRRGEGADRLLDAEAARTEQELVVDELRARVLELEELRKRQEAAPAKPADDPRVPELEAKVAGLESQLAARAVAPSSAGSSPDADRISVLEASELRLSGRVGQLSGQLMSARDLAQQALEERDRARAETLRLTAQVSNLETRMEGLRIGYEMRIAMLATEEPAPSTGTDEAIERELQRVAGALETLRGERDGLRLRLADREAALAAAQATSQATSQATKDSTETLDTLDRLREEVASLRAESSELTLRLAEAEEIREQEATRARDLAQAIASRDALVTRLQMDLAEEEHSHRLFAEQVARAESEVKRLREAVVEASQMVDAKERAEEEVEDLRRQVAALEQEEPARDPDADAQMESLKNALAEAKEARAASESALADAQQALVGAQRAQRDSLEEERKNHERAADAQKRAHEETLGALRQARKLLDEWRAEEGTTARSAITAVGVDAPEEDRWATLEREVADKDTLLRSLTAQLEERDDRIRALERRVAEAGDGTSLDAESMRQALLEFEERAARLQEELDHERRARATAERDLADAVRRPDAEAELDRLRRVVREREGSLEEALSRVESFERDVASLRGVVAEARHGLESLLGDATSSGDPATAERIGALLGVLGGF